MRWVLARENSSSEGLNCLMLMPVRFISTWKLLHNYGLAVGLQFLDLFWKFSLNVSNIFLFSITFYLHTATEFCFIF